MQNNYNPYNFEYDKTNWISVLVEYWIKRTNSNNKNTYNQNIDKIIKPYINVNYEVIPCIYTNNTFTLKI
jgi:hypothetical protein